MGGLIRGLFGDGGAAKRARQAQEQQRILADRQRQDAQRASQETTVESGAVRRAPKGQRLLISGDAGGLATTLG